MRDINHLKDSLPKKAIAVLSRVKILNAFRMDEASMRSYASRLQNSSVRNLMAYVDAADQLARFIRTSGLSMDPFESIMACAGTLTPETRTLIQEVFGCRIHNKYGSRDCSDMACECEAGGLHVYSHHVHLEIVDSHGTPVPQGQTGRILVTLLSNLEFPLIRYDIGDIGCFSTDPCSCGRPFPLLGTVEGRTVEALTNTRGGFVTPLYVRHLIGVVHNPENKLQRFQLTQVDKMRYSLLLQIEQAHRTDYGRTVEPAIRRDLAEVLGPDALIETRFVDKIESEENGKFLCVRNLTTANVPPAGAHTPSA